ncbi:hypothetical protein WJX72_001236 [[Myrmecia] bisecta]|uniref:Uncharacterized protein n=1 Tax=[Myrmecia] bisecta TaxID=41462 RepID=A0AAW1Q9G6_9CHLO
MTGSSGAAVSREMVFTQSRLRELVQAKLPNPERASLVVLVNTRFSDVQLALEGVEEEDAVSTLQAYQRQIAVSTGDTDKTVPLAANAGGHIVGIEHAALLKERLKLASINHARNGVIWSLVFEFVYTHGIIALGVDDAGDIRYVLLDSNWEHVKLEDVASQLLRKDPATLNTFLPIIKDKTFGDFQGCKLHLPGAIRPYTRACLTMGDQWLKRAKAYEVLLDSAPVDYLKLERMSAFDDREATLDWLSGVSLPATANNIAAGDIGDGSTPPTGSSTSAIDAEAAFAGPNAAMQGPFNATSSTPPTGSSCNSAVDVAAAVAAATAALQGTRF